jgi:hypothetical protein
MGAVVPKKKKSLVGSQNGFDQHHNYILKFLTVQGNEAGGML